MDKKIVLLIFIFACITGLCFYEYNSRFFHLKFIPSDYYEPLVSGPISFDREGKIGDYKIINKYKGKHALVAFTENPISFKEGFFSDMHLKVIVKNNGKVIYSKTATQFSSWIKDRQGETGFYLFWYNVPSDLPKLTQLNLELFLIEKDRQIRKKYGMTKFFLIKQSDE